MSERIARLALAAQVVFFLGWAGVEERRRATVVTVLLETVPADPRDVLSGDYLVLRYPMNRVDGLPGVPVPAPIVARPVAVRLVPVDVAGRRVWRAAGCTMPAPPLTGRLEPDGSLRVAGTWLGRGQVRYGIERFYFSEHRQAAMNAYRPGSFLVEAGVVPGGRLVLKRLVPAAGPAR